MRALMELDLRMRELSEKVKVNGAKRTAGCLVEVSQLLNPQRFDPLLLDLVPRLLDPSLLRQEIEATTKHKLERWYTLRTFLPLMLLMLLVLIFVIFLILTILSFPLRIITVFLSTNSFIIFASGFQLGVIILYIWFYSGSQIQKSRRRTEQVYSELSLEMQDITSEFLLTVAKSTELPRQPSMALSTAASQIQRALEQSVKTNEQAFQKLIATNQDAVQAILSLNSEVKTRVGAFDGQITPELNNFSAAVHDYQKQITQANTELTIVLRQIATTNANHLHIEQNLSTQIGRLSDIQQETAERTEAIVASMSSTAQTVINIADRLSHRQHQSSSENQSATKTSGSPRELEIGHVFDVFLSYSNEDRSTVKAIAEQLKTRGIEPWLDEWEMRPGIPWQSVLGERIPYIKSVAVFIGEGRSYPWQNKEMRALLREFVRRDSLIIPVILPDFDQVVPELPAFLGNTTWVDFRQKDPAPLETLSWGITGRRVIA